MTAERRCWIAFFFGACTGAGIMALVHAAGRLG